MDTSFKIYNASAGSGKTYTLTKAYLKIVLKGNRAYRKILAITFTNKAVNEMKERILGNLFDFSRARDSAMFEAISTELGLTREQLQRRAAIVLKEILHNYSFFDIVTIDKFTHRLIRTFAKDLKLPQNFEVVLDTDLLLDEAVSKLINKAGHDPKLTTVLIDFALQKIDDDKSWDISIDLNKIGNLLFNENNTPHLKKLESKTVDTFLGLQHDLQKRLHAHENDLITLAQKTLELIQDSGLQPTDFPRATLPNHFKKIAEGTFDPAKLYSNTLEETLRSGKLLKAAIEVPTLDLAPRLLERYLEIKQKIYDRALLKNVYHNIVPLTVLNAIQAEVKTIEEERDQLSISEFNSLIANEIKNQPAPFIYERLGEKYRHYFIDEFQDTSEMQWKNLIPLIDNALAGENGSLFLVGDAKQAIYRWRGGRAEQFLNLVNLQGNPFVVAPEIEVLPQNYRSHAEIVEFNNAFFTATSPLLSNETYRVLFEQGNHQRHSGKEGGLVQLTFVEPNEVETMEVGYGNEVLRTIETVRQKNYAYSDICILVRGNKEGAFLADYLTQYQIPIISSESLLLKNNAKIGFLVDLLKWQQQPDDEEIAYGLLSFLARRNEDPHAFISRHINNISELWTTTFSYDWGRLKTLSVYDTLEYAIKQFDLASDSDGYLNHFMDVVMDVEQKEGIGAPVFLNYWEKKKDRLGVAAPETVNAVQIMTVHKAKGLEFEIVIFPFANSNIYQEIEPKLWLPVASDAFHGFEEVLISKKQEVLEYSPIAETCYTAEQQQLELDAFNILYVALTRAVKALFVITKKDLTTTGAHKPNYYSGLFVHFLKEKGIWSDTMKEYTFGALPENRSHKTINVSLEIPYQYTYKERPSFKILAKSGLLWDTPREEALIQGNLIHRILGLIETGNDLEKALNTLQISGEVPTTEVELLKNRIRAILEHPKLVPYYRNGLDIKNEKDIITAKGDIVRPDRIVIEDSKATIIDYKTGIRKDSHKEQIYAYADALEAMGYTIADKIIVYSNETVNPVFL